MQNENNEPKKLMKAKKKLFKYLAVITKNYGYVPVPVAYVSSLEGVIPLKGSFSFVKATDDDVRLADEVLRQGH